MIDKNTLISWFKRGMKPLAAQYEAWLNSYWHKSEKLPVSSITELETILNNKSDNGHMHVIRDTTDLEVILRNKSDRGHKHMIDDVNGLQDEITQRKETDKKLQDDVDSLKKITMIRGAVEYYWDLFAIDTTSIREGDSYIVLNDDTRGYISTLYVWSAGTWTYRGEWAGGGRFWESNLATNDLYQYEQHRNYTIPERGSLRFGFYYGNCMELNNDSLIILMENIDIEASNIRFVSRYHRDKFVYFDTSGVMQYLTVTEFRNKLGIY